MMPLRCPACMRLGTGCPGKIHLCASCGHIFFYDGVRARDMNAEEKKWLNADPFRVAWCKARQGEFTATYWG